MAGEIEKLQTAGFSDDEIATWATSERDNLKNAGFRDNEIDAWFNGGVVAPERPPQAFLERLYNGDVWRKTMETFQAGKEAFGPEPLGLSDANTKKAQELGIYRDPVTGKGGSLFLETAVHQGAVVGDLFIRSLKAGVHMVAEHVGQLAESSDLGTKEKAKNETINLLNWAMMRGDMQIGRIHHTPEGPIKETVGALPKTDDFSSAAKVAVGDGTAPRSVQEKLLRAYDENGVHPSELANDISSEPVAHQRLLSKDPKDLPYGEAPPPEPPPPKPKEPPEPPAPGSFEEAQQKVLSRISVGEREGGRPLTWSRIYTETIDDLHPIKAVSEEAYEMARLTRGQFGKADHFLEHGTFDFNTYQTTGKPLREILKPVRDDLDGLRGYLTSKRTLELEGQGRKTGVDVEAAQLVVDRGHNQFAPIAKELIEYQQATLKYLKDSGVLSEEAYAAMLEMNKDYVPFYRVIGDGGGGPGAGRSFGPANPVKALKGSERIIVDPIESIVKNTYAYINVAERNQVGITLIDALKKEGFQVETKVAKAESELVGYLKEQGVTNPDKVADFIKGSAPEDGTTIGAWRDGKRETVKVDDPELVKAFLGMDQQSAGLLTRILAMPARGLRAGSVLTPDFIARNVIRDFMTAIVNSKGVFSPIDTGKGLVAIIRKDADFQNWLKAGGANSTLVALDRAYLQESLTKLAGETGLMDRAWNVVRHPIATVTRPLRMVSELIENATRVGEFKKVAAGELSKEALQAAAFASREVTLDFARSGARMRSWNMITAFMNAQIQGVDRVARAFIDRPANTTLKVAGSITAPSVLLWWANHGDQRYEELPAWQKDLFWIIPTDKWEPIDAADAPLKPDHLIRRTGDKWEFNNGSIYRIPKPFELGVIFGSGVERILSATVGKDEEAFKNFTKSVWQILTPNVTPTAVQPLIEQYANRSTFTDRTLIPADVEKQLPEYQYTPYTTQLSRKLGQLVTAFPGMREASIEPGNVAGPVARALSTPVLIENYIRGWSGGMGMYGLEAADAALRKAGVLPDPIKPAATLADIPFVKAFAVRYPSATAQSIQDFYDDNVKAEKFFQTYMAKAQEGDVEALARIQAAGGMAMFGRLEEIKSALTEHSKIIRDIYKNPEMPADEKRQLIDGLYYAMIEIGRAGKGMQKRIREVEQ